MRYSIIVVFLLSFIFSCKTAYHIDTLVNAPSIIDEHRSSDVHIDSIIRPYRNALSDTMSTVLVFSKIDLVKQQPESTLGNVLADACKYMAEQYTNKKVDVGIMNYGGIRVPQLAKGPVTIGEVFELMPFENELVVIEMKGTTLDSLLNIIAIYNGWPIAGITMEIADKKAKNIKINKQALDTTKIYRVAISDYLANGGDRLDLLKRIPQEKTNKLLRNSFIEYFIQLREQNKLLDSSIEGRIIKNE